MQLILVLLGLSEKYRTACKMQQSSQTLLKKRATPGAHMTSMHVHCLSSCSCVIGQHNYVLATAQVLLQVCTSTISACGCNPDAITYHKA